MSVQRTARTVLLMAAVAVIGVFASATTASAFTELKLKSSFGSEGSGSGQLLSPRVCSG